MRIQQTTVGDIMPAWIRERSSAPLALLFVISLMVRLFFWQGWGTLTADAGGHSIGGVLVARLLLNGLADPVGYARLFVSHYWKATAIFYWPYGYDIATTISYLLFGASDFAARLPNRLASIFLFYPVYLLGSFTYDKRTGYVAAAIVAVAPFSITWGGEALVDVPMVFLMTFAAYYLLRATETNKRRDWLLGGLLLGLASWMKPTALVFGPPLYGVALLFNREYLTNVWYYVSGTIALALFAVYPLSGIVVANLVPEISGPALTTMRWFSNALVHAEAPDPTWQTVAGWVYYIERVPRQLGWMAAVLALVGIAVRIRDRVRNQAELALLAAVGFVYLMFVFLDNKDPRYVMPYLPLLTIFAARGVLAVSDLIRDLDWPTGVNVTQRAAVVALLLVLALSATTAGHRVNHTDSGIEAAAEYVTERDPGLVVVYKNTNSVAVSAISFYVAANDPGLDHSVAWYSRVDESTWVISATKLPDSEVSEHNLRLTERFDRDETVFVYKRTV